MTIPDDYIDAQHTGNDRHLLEMFYGATLAEGGTSDEITLRGIKAVLLDAIQPISVSERLPEARDCDAEGRCWIHMPDIGTAPSWRLVDPGEIGPYHTHWLPFNALPLPSGDVEP